MPLACQTWRLGRHSLKTLASYRVSRRLYSSSQVPPLIQIENATFYRRQPSVSPTEEELIHNRPLFPNLSFALDAAPSPEEHWTVIGPSNAGKTTLLEILKGQLLCFPPNARSYPYLSTDEIAQKDLRLRYPSRAIQYVGFGDGGAKGLSGLGTYMSARYESRREVTDFSLLDYLKGNVHLNAFENVDDGEQQSFLQQVINDLKLERLIGMPVNNLSNGQSRRARIAKALLGRPALLLLDEPFMGLDPPTTLKISQLLYRLAQSRSPRLLLALRPQDPIPDWITHVLLLGEDLTITHRGPRKEVAESLAQTPGASPKSGAEKIASSAPRFNPELVRALSAKKAPQNDLPLEQKRQWAGLTHREDGKEVISMKGVQVKYGDKTVLGDWKDRYVNSGRYKKPGLHWTVREGDRWGLFGANGSGKTTLISMITSDHPQAYSNPLKVFGRHRLPSSGEAGISVFELQARIGHSSPEVHAFFPRNLSVRRCLESAYADTPLTRPRLTSRDDRRINACLRWFQAELNPALGPNEYLSPAAPEQSIRADATNSEAYREIRNEQHYEYADAQAESIDWADTLLFGELSASAAKVALFLRAIVKAPELVILDEAFSGLDDLVRDKCLLFLEAGDTAHIADVSQPLSKQNIKQIPHQNSTTKFAQSLQENSFGGGLAATQALIVVSHVKEELPICIKDWLALPESGEGDPCRTGTLGFTALRDDEAKWREIWAV